MEENKNVDLEEFNGEDVPEIVQTFDESGENDITDWKAEAEKYRGLAARNFKKLGKATETLKKFSPKPDETPKPEENKKEFDRIDKLFLKQEGVKPEEYEFVFEKMKEGGFKDIELLLNNKYFQAELSEKRERQSSQDALPDGKGRTGSGPTGSKEYWLKKIDEGKATVLDITDLKLREEVLETRSKRESEGNTFTDNPIIR